MPPPKPKVAIIFVPGIFASHVTDPEHPFGVMWPVNNPSMLRQVFRSSFEQRTQMAESARFTVPDSENKRGRNTVLLKAYGAFLDAVQEHKDFAFEPVVFAAGYNFIQGNRRTADEYILPAALRALSEPGITAILFVTHSMGCLPVRALLHPQAAYRRLASSCVGVVHASAPNNGSPEVLGRYIRGVLPIEDAAIRYVFGDNGWKATTTASAIPATYELLPVFASEDDRKALVTATGKVPAFGNDPYFLKKIVEFHFESNREANREAGRLSRFGDALAAVEDIRTDVDRHARAAMRFRAWLGSSMFDRSWAVATRGRDTLRSLTYAFETPAASDGKLVFASADDLDKEGDGTVPFASQIKHLENRHTRIDEDIEHSESMANNGVIQAVIAAMNRLYTEYETAKLYSQLPLGPG